ncbi:YiiX/YebB-like N1pC/P60 family cysteine hydrolase [Clostridium sp.]|uniref:YiiX/YebB-like N1pC/P60 family cysteine hydrolase n=1 Tax=Clostridium sp. TaxID=1506 RepID=UPI003D6D2593
MFWIKMFIVLTIGIIFFAFVLRLILRGYFINETGIMDRNMELLNISLNADIDKCLNLINELERVVSEIQNTESLFAEDNKNMSYAHKQSILGKWVSYVECYNGLNEIRKKYKIGIIFKGTEDSYARFNSILLNYSSTIAIRKNSVLLASIIEKNKYLESMLNESRPEHNINKKQYYYITQEITEISHMILLFKNKHYFDFMVSYHEIHGYGRDEKEEELLDYASCNYLNVVKLVRNHRNIVFNNILDFFGKNVFDFWFPVQKWIAISITGVDYSSREEKYVSNEDINTIKEELRPGDILLKRNDYQLTNIGLPGFWTHSGIYIGCLKKLDSYFKDMQLGDYSCVSEYVKVIYPKVYDSLCSKDNVEYIIEVIAPGVVINPLNAIAKVDYFSALRPKLSKKDKLGALFIAFDSLGKAYDYNFDIMTDNALFCSELIYKSYLCSSNKKGLKFNLEPKAGRLLLSPNSIIKKFDEEFDDENSEFDFVAFYDGSERDKKAISKDAMDLKITWKLTWWKIVKSRIISTTETRYPVVKMNLVLTKLKFILYGMF